MRRYLVAEFRMIKCTWVNPCTLIWLMCSFAWFGFVVGALLLCEPGIALLLLVALSVESLVPV